MKLDDINAGELVQIDDGFTCAKSGLHMVERNKLGFYIRCDHGKHYLDGHEDERGNLIGISQA